MTARVSTWCSAIAERPRCRVRYTCNLGQKWKTGTGRQYFRDITGLYLQPLWHNRPENLSNSVKNAK